MKIGQLDTKNIIVTDFETFYDDDYTLRKLRAEEYIADPRFKVHGLAVADHKGKTDFVEPAGIPKYIKAHRKHTIVNHKMTFDGLIWKMRYNHVAPFMVDTLFLANHVYGPAEVSGGNDLETLAERLGLQPKGRIEMFKGKRDLTPEEHAALAAYATNDADLTYNAFTRLLPRISRPEFELWLMDHTLRIYITKPLPVLAKVAVDTIKSVERQVEKCMAAVPKVFFDFSWDKPYVRKGVRLKERITTKKRIDADVLASNPQFGQALTQIMKKEGVSIPSKKGKNGMIPALAKADEGFIALKNSNSKTVRALVTARLVKRSGDTQVARLRSLIKCSKVGGFRVYLNYWGAVTGRWTGGSGLNAHNFPNPSRSTDDFEREVATLIRQSVVPGKGNKFVAVDAANIEARVCAWWAGQQDLVDAFGNGTDVYSEFAASTFGEEVRKPTKEDSKDKSARLKLLRGAGKVAILGLGYSMGAPKFELQQRSKPDINPLFVSGDLDTRMCVKIVNTYRAKYPKIVQLWAKTQAAFFSAASGAKRMVNGVLFEPMPGHSVAIVLPSGRSIHYPNVRVGEHESESRGKHKQWVYGHGKGKKIYGGLLVENVVQAISRDILAEAVWSMEDAGFDVAYHVHDSVVTLVDGKDADRCMNYCIEVLSAAPEWAPTMRLGAEGAVEDYFS